MNYSPASIDETTRRRARRLAVVTGAASGIGLATAQALLARGTAVVGVDTAEMPPELADRGIEWVTGDVASAGTWTETARRADALGGADCLIACAGTIVVAPFLDTAPSDWSRLFETNVVGTIRGMQALLPGMLARRDGAIAVVCSVNSLVAEDRMSAYSTSKAALLHAVRSAAVEHARHGVRINAVLPGATDTPLLRRHLASLEDPSAALKAAARRTPLGRLLHPAEVAETLCFLVDPSASGLVGAAVTVDGGLIATYDFDAAPDAAPS